MRRRAGPRAEIPVPRSESRHLGMRATQQQFYEEIRREPGQRSKAGQPGSPHIQTPALKSENPKSYPRPGQNLHPNFDRCIC